MANGTDVPTRKPVLGDVPSRPVPGEIELDPAKIKKFQPVERPPKSSSTLWQKLWTPIVSERTAARALAPGMTPEKFQENVEKYHGWMGGLARAERDVNAISADLLSSLTSPGQIGLMVATAGGDIAETAEYKLLSRALKIPTKAAVGYFGLQGMKVMATPQQANEDFVSSVERRSLGAAAVLGSTVDLGMSGVASFKGFLKKQFGLNDDLAGKVADQTNKIDTIRKQTATAVSKVDAETQEVVAKVQKGLESDLNEVKRNTSIRSGAIRKAAEDTISVSKEKLENLQADKLRTGAQIVADTMQALVLEEDRVQKPFIEMASEIKGPVAEQTTMRSLIEEPFKSRNIDPKEIPASAFKTLSDIGNKEPSIEVMGKATRWSELTDYQREQLGGAFPETAKGQLTFDGLTRLREDLWQSAAKSTDTGVKAALFDAHDKVTDFQEKIAAENNFGPKYRAAKQEYKVFRRGLGSGLMLDWLKGSDAESQAVAPKIADLTTRQKASALRTVLKAAGVDVGPLDKIVSEMRTTGEAIKSTSKEAKAAVSETEQGARRASTALKQSARQSTREAKAAGKELSSEMTKASEEEIARGKRDAGAIIPGRDIDELRGKSNPDLLRMRLQHQAANMRVANPWAFMSMIYGLVDIVSGRMWGIPLAAVGYGRLALPRLMRDKGFQDWLIRQAGEIPGSPVSARLRRGISALTPMATAATVKTAEDQLGEVPNR